MVPMGRPLGYTPPRPLVITMSPTLTVWSSGMVVSVSVPSALPRSVPWARVDCTMADTREFSSFTSLTTEVVGPHSMIWPITPVESHTGMPTSRPEVVPLSMVTVDDHESVEPAMMRAPVACRL